MAKLVIEISEEKLSIIKNKMYCGIYDPDLYKAIANGTPFTDILNKIRDEINRQWKWLLQAGYTTYNVDVALDAILSVVESESKE